MKRLLKLLLCLSLSLTLFGCQTSNEVKKEETVENLDFNQSYKAADMNPEVVKPLQEIDTTTFYETYNKLEKLIEEDKKDEAFKTFNELLDQSFLIEEMSIIANVYHSENVVDEKITEIYSKDVTEFEKAKAAVNTIGNKLVKKYKEDFKKALNNDWYYEFLSNSDKESEETIAIKQEITKLQNEYTVLKSKFITDTINYKGKDYTTSDIAAAEDLTDDEKMDLAIKMVENQNKQIGEVYLKIVKKSNELANKYGYDNYADYADKCVYFRDYSSEDLKSFYAAVKEAAKDYTRFGIRNIENNGASDILNIINQLSVYMPKYAQDTFTDLVKNKLFVIGSGNERAVGGYSAYIPSQGKAMIYFDLGNINNDITGLIHEIGHSSEGYHNPTIKTFDHNFGYDVAETHSTGLEVLMIDPYGKVMNEKDAAINKANVLNNKIQSVLQGCLLDEWQRKVYTTPDITLDEVNNLFNQIFKEYYGEADETNKYLWSEIPHVFMTPFYNISYATSAIIAMQIYELAKTDRDKAIKTWESLVESGTNSNYMEAVNKAGLIPFTNIEETTKIFKNCINELNETVKSLTPNEDYYLR